MPLPDTSVSYTNNLKTAVRTSVHKRTAILVFPFRVKTNLSGQVRTGLSVEHTVSIFSVVGMLISLLP